MNAIGHWLAGRRGIVAGGGEAADYVADALALAGAAVERIADPSTDASDIAVAFDTAQAKLGGTIDLLVHAGVAMAPVSAETIDLDGWRATLSADIDGRFLFTAELGRRLIAAELPGSVLFLMPSSHISGGRSAGAAADGALANLVKSLAVEWARLGIRTNAIRSRACEPGGLREESVRRSLGYLSAYLSSGYGAYITGIVMGTDELPPERSSGD